MRRIAALVPNMPGVSPGQRARIESWAPHLEPLGWTVDFYPFEDSSLNEVLYRPGGSVAKASHLVACYWRQLLTVLKKPSCDLVFVYREAALAGPALLERLARRLDVPMVYDIDDPVFVPYRSPTSGWTSLLKCPGKTRSLFRMADHVIAVNSVIGDYAARYNPAVTVIPNFVDLNRYHPVDRPVGIPVRLVWTGSHTTLPNLTTILPTLRRVEADRNASLRIVVNGSVSLPGLKPEVREFSAKNQASDLQDCDIGLAPLLDTSWNRWKSFFKIVQYMAVGLPVVAQDMGSNNEIIEEGKNGFLVHTQEEWYQRLHLLVHNSDLRREMGEAARRTAVEGYSADFHMKRVAALFDEVVSR